MGLIVTKFATEKFNGINVRIKSRKELVPKTDSFVRWLVDVIVLEGEYADKSVSDIYTELGVNKYIDGYSEENVRKLLI